MCRKLEELLAFHSAPALCGLKASNLISLNNNNFIQDINQLNKMYNPNEFFTFLKESCD